MMTPQETESLQDFLSQLKQVQGIAKDPQAAAMIATAMAQQPDAGYLLVQRAMLLDQALATAQAQIKQLQDERERLTSSNAAGTGFLDPVNAWGRSAHDAPRAAAVNTDQRFGQSSPSPYPSPPQYPAPGAVAPGPATPEAAPARPGFLGGGGGFLGNMAATAAGVAGGAFLFQGIGSLLGQHNNPGAGLLGQHNPAPPAVSPAASTTPAADSERLALNSDSSADSAGTADDFDSGDDLGSLDDMSSI